jgi:hypothetical protein
LADARHARARSIGRKDWQERCREPLGLEAALLSRRRRASCGGFATIIRRIAGSWGQALGVVHVFVAGKMRELDCRPAIREQQPSVEIQPKIRQFSSKARPCSRPKIGRYYGPRRSLSGER